MSGQTWEDVGCLGEANIPPPLLLQENLRSLKLDLLSSIFQGLYPTEGDCEMVKHFISCPASLEEKYSMMRLSDLLKSSRPKIFCRLDHSFDLQGRLCPH